MSSLNTKLSRDLFLKHEVYNDLAVCLIHRHFDMASNERLVEFGAVSAPWTLTQVDQVAGGTLVPRSWIFNDSKMSPYEFGYNEAIGEPTYRALPNKPHFYEEFGKLLKREGLENLLGLTLNSDEIQPGLVKFEKTFGRVNVLFNVARGGLMEEKESIPAQWNYKPVGDMIVPVKK